MQVYPCEKTKLVHLIHSSLFTSAYNTMAYIRCQNYILLLIILFCDIDITFCNMHGLFGYLMSHYTIFVLYYAT